MKKASEIWDTPEATGFDKVIFRDVEEIVGAFVKRAHERDCIDWLRTTLIQHFEAEVERAVRTGKVQALHVMEDLYAKAVDKADLIEMVNEAILTPTKTDKQ